MLNVHFKSQKVIYRGISVIFSRYNLHNFNTFIITLLALLAFAANSVLCRLALQSKQIDPASFTLIRLLSAMLILIVLISFKQRIKKSHTTIITVSWNASFALFIYAITFSFAYTLMDTAVGALVLFATVQVSMILSQYWHGKRLNIIEWGGLLLAFAGFIYLILPDLTSPSLFAFILMVISGIAWAFYTLKGKNSLDPLLITKVNFVRTLPLVIILALFTYPSLSFSVIGLFYALLSGVVASVFGYCLWYLALRKITTTTAAVVQLLVPIFAAIAGELFLHEPITINFITSAIMVLGGILMVTLSHQIINKP